MRSENNSHVGKLIRASSLRLQGKVFSLLKHQATKTTKQSAACSGHFNPGKRGSQFPSDKGSVGQIVSLQLVTNRNISVGFEVLTGVVMKSTIFWGIISCSPLQNQPTFRGTYHLHLQGRRIGRAKKQSESRWQSSAYFSTMKMEAMFHRNAGWLSTDYTALYPRRQYSSEKFLSLFEIRPRLIEIYRAPKSQATK
jgi:hypothetical protein